MKLVDYLIYIGVLGNILFAIYKPTTTSCVIGWLIMGGCYYLAFIERDMGRWLKNSHLKP